MEPAVTDNRNIVAFMDLAEKNLTISPYCPMHGAYPDNQSNDLLTKSDTAIIRNINKITGLPDRCSFFGYVSA
ncbi:MAG: hypothetical protein IPH20_16475 [Bacteroidales bacterium]|nr:hypothetical protein [Bacteroidales bacterium]